MSYLTNCNILINNKFGFRNKYSTAMAVLEMVDKISDAIDNKYYSLGVYIDLGVLITYIIFFPFNIRTEQYQTCWTTN